MKSEMLFAVLFTLGESKSIGVSLMLLLITTDLHQLLDVGWKKSLGLTIRTGVFYVLILGLVFLLISVLVVSLAWFNGRQAL